ncbi:MAG: CoA-binding protein [Candidatus Abyssubacteria bacterium]|nr:CoA-binding protein [Candidatus Abyssubacteria bacterium]
MTPIPEISRTLDSLFKPRSVALVGASKNPGKWGFLILMNLHLGGYKGKIYPVNPGEKEILGFKVYPSMSAVPEPVDLALVVVPPAKAPQVLRECAGKTKVALVIAAGFGELGPEAKRLEADLVGAAREGGIRVVGPNCNGVMCASPPSLYALMPSYFPPPNTFSMASQSGNIGGILLRMSMQRGCGFGKYVSTGNEADLHMEDYFEYFMDDPETEVILSYVEGARDGKKLMQVARKITPHKPIVMIKGGRTPAGAAAADSHTGSLAGSDAVFSAMCRQSGIILVDDVDELLDVALALKRQPPPGGRRAGILTTGGGLGVLSSDVCDDIGLEVASLKEDTLRKLDGVLPPWWNRGNPVDLVAGLSRSSVRGCLQAIATADEIDGVFMIGLGLGSSRAKLLKETPLYEDPALREMVERSVEQEVDSARTVVNCLDTYKKPILVVSDSATLSDDNKTGALEILESNGIYPYPTFRRAATVMKHLIERQRFLRKVR